MFLSLSYRFPYLPKMQCKTKHDNIKPARTQKISKKYKFSLSSLFSPSKKYLSQPVCIAIDLAWKIHYESKRFNYET